MSLGDALNDPLAVALGRVAELESKLQQAWSDAEMVQETIDETATWLGVSVSNMSQTGAVETIVAELHAKVDAADVYRLRWTTLVLAADEARAREVPVSLDDAIAAARRGHP